VWYTSENKVVGLFRKWKGVVEENANHRTIKASAQKWDAVASTAARYKFVSVGLWDTNSGAGSKPNNKHSNFTSKYVVVPWGEQEKRVKNALGVVSVVYSIASVSKHKPYALVRKLDAKGQLCVGEGSWQCRRLEVVYGAAGETNKPSLPTLGWMASEDVHKKMKDLFENGNDAEAVKLWHKDDLEEGRADVRASPTPGSTVTRKRKRKQAKLQTEVATSFTDTREPKKPAVGDYDDSDTVSDAEEPHTETQMQKPKCTRMCTCPHKCRGNCKKRKSSKRCPGKCCGCKCTSYRLKSCAEGSHQCEGKLPPKTPTKNPSSKDAGTKRGKKTGRGTKRGNKKGNGGPAVHVVTTEPPVPAKSEQAVRDMYVLQRNAQATAEFEMRKHDLELMIEEEKLKTTLQQMKAKTAAAKVS
jgi:hypothetical protein